VRDPVKAKGLVGSNTITPSGPITPERKPIDEMCPSPTARVLMTKRSAAGGKPD
jgi:hypothetical protein